MPRFIVGAAAFAKALAQVAPVIVAHPAAPILENVKLECQRVTGGHQLVLTCSDLETILQTTLFVESASEWVLCVPAKKLLDTLRALPDQPLTCNAEEDTYRLELSAARSRYNLAGENASDYPRAAKHVTVQRLVLPAAELRTALLAVLPAASSDDLRPGMCGIHFETKQGNLVAVIATDGHRVHQYNFLAGQGDGGFTVPTKAASFLLSLLEESAGKDAVVLATDCDIRLEDGRWATRLIEDRFPDYRGVMPLASPVVAVADRDELLAALRRLDRYSDTTYRAARFDFADNLLKLSANDPFRENNGSETVDCAYEGEPFAIGFNCPFVQAQLKAMPAGPVRLGMSTPARASMATADSEGGQPKAVALLMPVSLDVVAL